MKKHKGFTFVELLVVITIIGVVFAAGIVSYTTISKNSRNARRRADLEAIRQALEICRSIDSIYPTTGQGIYPSVLCYASDPDITTMTNTPLDPKYVGVGGTCPANGQYTYISASGTTYTLAANCAEDVSISVTNP